jgi:protein TonB
VVENLLSRRVVTIVLSDELFNLLSHQAANRGSMLGSEDLRAADRGLVELNCEIASRHARILRGARNPRQRRGTEGVAQNCGPEMPMRSAFSLFVALVAASALAQVQDTHKLEARGERFSIALDVRELANDKAECDATITDLSTHTVIWQPRLTGDDSKLVSTMEKDGVRYELTILLYPSFTAADFIIDRQGVIVDSLRTGWGGPSHTLEMNASGAYNVGRNVKAPRVIRRVEPAYPLTARTNGVKGIVIMQVLIDKTGAVRQVMVLKGLTPDLSQAAVDAVRQWQWAPATLDGKPVDVVFNLTINFKLD